ncbi:MAG: EcsC family protein [Hyphomicrobiales bacterium]|nr:EcsC family protein [Hyphomicrobiales bacterium]
MTALSFEDEQALSEAVRRLEHTSLAARLTHMLGSRIEAAGSLFPEAARKAASAATDLALKAAMRTAIKSLGNKSGPARTTLHKSLAAASGAAGGALGFTALAVELPVSATLMLRTIADIARAEGEDMTRPETALACMEVFALGGRKPDDDYLDSSYFAVRTVLASSMSEAASYLAHVGTAKETAPVLMRFLSEIATRFGIVVSQKAAAQAVPVIGAIGGASINYAFMDHYQGLAAGHFTVRRLERKYGKETIEAEYERLEKIWRKFTPPKGDAGDVIDGEIVT